MMATRQDSPPILLSRTTFRETVLARHEGRCCLCPSEAVDAHHILERRLWPDGGYYLDNGAAVCEEHHLACERTLISVEDVRAASGITRILVPPHMDPEDLYDKWGNPILPNGHRLRGELFADLSVQKALREGGVLDRFLPWVKYPKTAHLPWSGTIQKDDRVQAVPSAWVGQTVVVTEKMDGENTSIYRDHIHARSVDSPNHLSRNWVKNWAASIQHEIPDGWRICGENLYARHTIPYGDLPHFFLGFSIWNEANVCLSWAETQEWFDLLGIVPVPVLYEGIYNETWIRALATREWMRDHEGYVIRPAAAFTFRQFTAVTAKYVRPGHNQDGSTHGFRYKRVIPNHLASEGLAPPDTHRSPSPEETYDRHNPGF